MTIDRPADEPGFAIDVRVDGARTLVVLSGEIDSYTAPRMNEAFAELDDVAGRHVVLDLADVGFVDSAGLSAIVLCMGSVRRGGGAVSVRSMSPQLLKLFEITGISRMFPVD